jgi:hypothetical protein
MITKRSHGQNIYKESGEKAGLFNSDYVARSGNHHHPNNPLLWDFIG